MAQGRNGAGIHQGRLEKRGNGEWGMGRQCQQGWEGNSLLPPTGSLQLSPVNHSLIAMNPKSTCSSPQ